MKKFLFVAVMALCVSLSFQAFAAGLVLSTLKVKLDVAPGEEVVDTIKVSNPSDQSAIVKLSLQDFVLSSPFTGEKKFLPMGTDPRSCGGWISFEPREFDLPPKGEQEIAYRIKVPEDVKGGYYSVLMAERSPVGFDGKVGLGVRIKIGCLFFLETEDKTKEGKIKDVTAVKDTIGGYFSNEGDVILLANGTFYVIDKEGVMVDRGDITGKQLQIPPEEKSAFTVNVPKDVSPGNYTLVLNFDLQEEDLLMKEIDFTKDKAGNVKIVQIRD